MTIVAQTFEVPWTSATEVCTTGNPFTPGPGSGDPTEVVVDTTPLFIIPAATKYNVVHTVEVVDTRDSEEIQFANFTIATDDGSICWTLNANGGPELFDRFRILDNSDLPIVSITIDGQEWQFIIENVRRNRSFGQSPVSLTGRSITMQAGDPYSFTQNWVNQGPITAAQIVDQAQDYTQLETIWLVDDWFVPDRVWSFSGTPLAVAQRVAETVKATVISDRKEMQITIEPRYRLMPHEWSTAQPDVEIHADAMMTDSYERADRPAYNAIMVSGQQQGAVARVFLQGTTADKMAPLVTDLLLTDVDACTQRGKAELGGSGPQAKVTMTLPVLTTDEAPGVLDPGWLCHIVDDDPEWWGVVRAVSVSVSMPSVLQTVTFERHTGDIEGTVVTP